MYALYMSPPAANSARLHPFLNRLLMAPQCCGIPFFLGEHLRLPLPNSPVHTNCFDHVGLPFPSLARLMHSDSFLRDHHDQVRNHGADHA